MGARLSTLLLFIDGGFKVFTRIHGESATGLIAEFLVILDSRVGAQYAVTLWVSRVVVCSLN